MSKMTAPFMALSLAAAVLAPAIARADSTSAATPPAPDKSAYTVFNPTPDAALRSLCTDRPTKSTGACTVDAGHWQIESDVVNVTIDHTGGFDTTTVLATNPTLKLGLTNTIDAELNIVPYETITTKDRATGITTRASGVGDLYGRLKINLLGDDGGDLAIALVPYVKAPTAPANIGNRSVEAGIIAPTVINLPASWQLTVDPELDLLKNGADNGRHLNASGLLSFSRPASKTVTFSVELWSDVNYDPQKTITQVSADLGLAWIPASLPNMQFDGGVNFGLNSVTPAAQVYVGISRRF
jgi:hypothetical protein